MIIRLKTMLCSILACLTVVMCAVLVSSCGKTESKPETAKEGTPAAGPAGNVIQGLGGGFVVDVNGTQLSETELASQLDRLFSSPRFRGMPPAQIAQARPMFRTRVIEGFIAQTLLQQQADAKGITLEADEVAKAMEEIKANIPEGRTLEELLTENGLTEDSLRSNVERDLKVQKLIDAEAPVPEPTDEDIDEFYNRKPSQFETPETAKARHILVKFPDDANDEAKAEKKVLAEQYRKQLVEGADFAELAKAHSDDPGSKDNGGDLGSFQRGRMVKPFEDAAFSQEIDEIGPIVETRFGYHILQVLERTEAKVTPLEEVKERIAQYLKGQKQQGAVAEYVEGLKSKAKIEYAEGAAPAAPPMQPMPPMQ